MKNTRRLGTVNRTNKANKVEHIAKFFRNHDNPAAAHGGNQWKWLINVHLVNQHFTITATRERGYTDNSVFTASLNSFMSHNLYVSVCKLSSKAQLPWNISNPWFLPHRRFQRLDCINDYSLYCILAIFSKLVILILNERSYGKQIDMSYACTAWVYWKAIFSKHEGLLILL